MRIIVLDLPTVSLCGYTDAEGNSAYETYIMIAHSTLILADAFVLYLTWYRTRALSRAGRILLDTRGTLSTALLRNGGAYFALLLILNVVSLAIGRNFFVVNGLVGLVSNLTSILTSRYIINVRRVTDADASTPSKEFSMKTMVFVNNVAEGVDSGTPEEAVADGTRDEEHGSTEEI